MELRIMTNESILNLKANLESYVKFYEKEDQQGLVEKAGIEFQALNKHVEDFNLDMSDPNPAKTEGTNIRLLYNRLSWLSPSAASDERLWAGLAHDHFWDYMMYRWKVDAGQSTDKKVNHIKQNYFFGHGNQRSLMTNPLARLWWLGHMLRDEENEEAPYALLEFVERDLNAISFPLFGSNMANNKRLLKAFLYTIMDLEKQYQVQISTRNKFGKKSDFVRALTIVNYMGGMNILDAISIETFKTKLKEQIRPIFQQASQG